MTPLRDPATIHRGGGAGGRAAPHVRPRGADGRCVDAPARGRYARRSMTDTRGTQGRSLVRDGDRLKAYRPLPADERRRLLDRALEAFAAGDFFETHEILEPAWMGTDDPRERAVLQGLIKLAAGYVHAVRGNATGMRKNLAGARDRLARGAERDPGGAVGAAVERLGVDVDGLVDAIDARLAALDADPGEDPAGTLLVDRVPPPAVGRIGR